VTRINSISELFGIRQKSKIERKLGKLEGDFGEGGRELTPRELTRVIMAHATELSMEELTTMTKQALTRMRIRKVAREEIVSRVIRRVVEIRTAKMR
jgi:hypothetical protein